MPKEPKIYVLHMLNHAQEAVALLHGLTEDDFNRNRVLRLAVNRLIQIVGEAARRVPEEFKLSHPSVPWKEASGMRNVLVHDYLSIDDRIIWRTVTTELPSLVHALQALPI
jgi:uncharacterized protein with HEPN domain